MVAATQGVTLDEAFQQLRGRARASSRKLADVAQEVVQEVQRERVAAKAPDDARVRAAEARAREAEQAPPTPASGPRMCAIAPPTTVTAMPTCATAPPTNATATAPPRRAAGPPTTPSSLGGWREQPERTSLAASERFPRRQVLLQRRHQEAGPPHAPSATAPSCSWAASNAARVRRLGRWPGSGPGGDRRPGCAGGLDRWASAL
jgi:hypothetical protein